MFENNCVENKQPPIKDAIIFMSAYNIHKFKRHHIQWKQKINSKELLEEFHIKGISHNNTYAAPYTKCYYTVEYNSIKQVTAYHFEEDIENIRRQYPDFSDEMMTILSLHHSSVALLDSAQIHISTCFNLESFLVVFDEKIFQVDPIVFMMNGALIVIFELIDFESGIPLEYDAIYGRSHNFGIQPIKKMKYFDADEFTEDNRTISEVIFENICTFLTKINRNKWIVDSQVPIITLNMISNIKTTASFVQYKNAIDFKIKTLNYRQENQRASNGRLMNILLYILALLGSAQTLQVLQTEFQLPFEYSFWIVLGLFAVFGIIWIIREIKKQ